MRVTIPPSPPRRKALAGKRIASMRDPLARGRSQMASRPALDLGAGRVRSVRSRHQRLFDRHEDLPRRLVRPLGRAQLPGECANADRRRNRILQPEGRRSAHASLDLRRSEGEEWTIDVDDRRWELVRLEERRLSACSSTAKSGGAAGIGEYPDIYREFVDLIDERRSDRRRRPLRLVADCLLVGESAERRCREPK